jgi:hypothetical protein
LVLFFGAPTIIIFTLLFLLPFCWFVFFMSYSLGWSLCYTLPILLWDCSI